ncbi:serum response factor blistered [Arctopsyche grandis]|uniref:serum response factor blistered n=1 Tax=Arctopsyche grandis TaxID=121162 RepID=UPI00406D6A7D
MEAPGGVGGGRDARFLPYNVGLLEPELYAPLRAPLQSPGAPPPPPLLAACPRGLKRNTDCYEERPPPHHPHHQHHQPQPHHQQQQHSQQQHHQQQQQQQHQQHLMEPCPVPELADDYAPLVPKKSPPSNGKKTKGRVKIKMEYIDNKLRRYTTFSKRKTGIMKKAYELSTLTGTQVMLLVASETGHVYTFATRKLQPMITSDSGKRLIQTCLNSPDPPQGAAHGGDQRMSATGFEETELTYNIADEETKVERSPMSSGGEESGDDSGSEAESPGQRQRSPSPETSNIPRDGNVENNALFSAAGGVLYPPGMILSLAAAAQAQEQGGNGQPQFITIPLSMAMAAAAASQQTTTVASQQSNGLQDLSRQSRK